MVSGKIAVLALLVLFISSANASVISGTVYSAETLEPMADSIVSIDSVPRQLLVAKDGAYSFSVGPGTFKFEAKFFENSELALEAEETVLVQKEGNYRVDLILFPVLESDENLLDYLNGGELGEPPAIDLGELEEQSILQNPLMLAAVIVVAVIAAGLVFYSLKKRGQGKAKGKETLSAITKEETAVPPQSKAELDEKAKEVLAALGEAGGRANQKDLIDKVGFGEAYLSLVLTELEHEGLVKKIKKGRGNVIILRQRQ